MRQSSLPPGSKVWIIARHSPGKNQSIDTQLNELETYCKINELIVVDRFIDAGRSGKNLDREEFTRMRRLVEGSDRNLVAGIIFYDLSRLARNFKDAKYIKALLRWKGYHLEWLIGREQMDGLVGAIFEDVEDDANEQFLQKVSRGAKNGLRSMLRMKDDNGKYFGFWPSHVPWGFRGVEKVFPVILTITNKPKVKQCIEPDYSLWPLGQELYTLRASGLTYREIEERTGFFRTRGTISKPSDSGLMAACYRNFFRNALYKGELRFQELVIPDFVPAMVSPELWQAANDACITYNWTVTPHIKVSKADPCFLLAGLCECGYCNGPFYTRIVGGRSQDKLIRYYICRTKRREGSAAPCPTRYISASPFEEAVIETTTKNYLSFIELVIEEMNELSNGILAPQREIEQIKAEITGLNSALRNLIRLAEKAEGVEEVWQRVAELKRQKQTAEARLNYLQRQDLSLKTLSAEGLRQSVERIKQKLISDPRIALRQIIEKISVNEMVGDIYYKLPLDVADSYPWGSLPIYQIGYTIELPTYHRG